MNSSFAFAALAVLSVFPLLAVSSAVVGGDIREAFVRRMGLNAEATRDVQSLIAGGNQVVATLTWVSGIILVLGGIGMAGTLSTWYHHMYERTPSKGLLAHLGYQAAGVAAFVLYVPAQVEILDFVRPVGGRGLVFLLRFATTTLFWWVSAYMFLYRQVPPRRMLPAGVATGVCLPGLVSSFAFFGSGHIGAAEVRAGRGCDRVDHVPRRLRCLPTRRRRLRTMWNIWQDERASLDNHAFETDDMTKARPDSPGWQSRLSSHEIGRKHDREGLARGSRASAARDGMPPLPDRAGIALRGTIPAAAMRP